MALCVPVSVGEFLDKLAILKIKSERIYSAEQLANVQHELQALQGIWDSLPYTDVDIRNELAELKSVNEMLWDIEDEIRNHEAEQRFDQRFIELARQVYLTNDRRAAIKRRLNELLGSELIEEKSYSQYLPPD